MRTGCVFPLSFFLLPFSFCLAAEPLYPPSWTDSLVYYQSFDTPDGKPEVNTAGLAVREMPAPADGGFRGRCGAPGAKLGRLVTLVSQGMALSPHQPLTISFWWALPEDVAENGGLGLVQLQGRGWIGHFARGGPWCGLKDTGGVVQVYNLPGITNINGIYDLKMRQTVPLRKGQWHHTAIVISAASLVSAYTEGKLVFETRTVGRAFAAEDRFNLLTLGGGVMLDEIAILSTPLPADQIAEYVAAMKGIRQAWGQ